jgi:hypothetical protein
MLQHVTRSRGWNITERVNGNVGNETKLGMVIPRIKSRMLQVLQKRGIGHRCLRFNAKDVREHRGHYGHPGPADNHSPERSLGDAWSIPEP